MYVCTVCVSCPQSGSKIRGNLTPQEKEVEIPVEAKVGVRAANVVTGTGLLRKVIGCEIRCV